MNFSIKTPQKAFSDIMIN